MLGVLLVVDGDALGVLVGKGRRGGGRGSYLEDCVRGCHGEVGKRGGEGELHVGDGLSCTLTVQWSCRKLRSEYPGLR